MDYGILSLLPPVVAIVLAMLTRNVVISLLLGVFVGATILTDGNPATGVYNTFSNFVIPSLGDEENATILIYCGLFGALVALLQRTGGARALADAMARKVRSARGSQGATFGFGLILFFDDYFNALTVGNVMRPLTDKFKVAREKLAYIVDSTSAPMSLMAPVSTWVVFVMGLIATQYNQLGIDDQTYLTYLKTIPFNFYALGAITLVGIVVFTKVKFGPMATAERRATETGQLMTANAAPPSASEITEMKPTEGSSPKIRNLLVPLIVLLLVTPSMFLITGGFPDNSIIEAVSEAEGALSILVAALLAIVTAIIMGLIDGSFKFTEAVETSMSGIKGMVLVYVILILAWSIGSVTEEVGTAQYIVGIVEGLGIESIVYMLVFLVAGIVAFTTGTSYGTFAIMLPIAMPLAMALDIEMIPAIAAVFSGGIFGDHCSPISDTTILSSAGSAADHIDHVKTQMPYSLTVAAVAALTFLVVGLTGQLWLATIVGILVLVAAVWLLSKFWPGKAPTTTPENSSTQTA